MNQITGDVIRKLFAVQLAPSEQFEEELESTMDLSEDDAHPGMQYNVSADGELVPAPGIAGAGIDMGASSDPRRAGEPAAPSIDFDRIAAQRRPQQMTMSRGPMGNPGGAPQGGGQAIPTGYENVGRNDPCPCGSGKKFKKCHGA